MHHSELAAASYQSTWFGGIGPSLEKETINVLDGPFKTTSLGVLSERAD